MKSNLITILAFCLVVTSAATPRVAASELRVTAITEQGAPLQITLELAGQLDDGSPIHRTTTTDEDGLGVFEQLGAGQYSVEAADPFTWKIRGELWSISEDETIERQLVMLPVAAAVDDEAEGGWGVVQTWSNGLTGSSKLWLDCFAQWGCSASYAPSGSDDEPRQTLDLSTQEQAEIQRLLTASRLFDGQQYGIDATAVDGPFDLLQVKRGRAVNVLVTSGNASFYSGSRARLLRMLQDLHKRAHSASVSME